MGYFGGFVEVPLDSQCLHFRGNVVTGAKNGRIEKEYESLSPEKSA